MDASKDDIKIVADALYQEGVTSFLATTLTSDNESLKRVCSVIKEAKEVCPSLLGIHLEGPYINAKYKGAQNEAFIRNPDIKEFDELNFLSGNNIKYISLAPEKEGALDFIRHITSLGVVASAGHTDASFNKIEEAIEYGLTNITHTHNAMSPHHHRNPGVVTAAMYFDELYTEVICDGIHVSKETLKAFYKIVGADRFIMITDALQIKLSDINEFKLFGLDCIRKNNAAYLTSGPLAGSLLTMEQGLKNLKAYIKNISLIDLMKVSSYNASKSLHLNDRGLLEENRIADIVLLDEELNVKEVYKLGKKVY
jgi:N-acetylglucosamine-6-phosphate deacetylase